MPDDALGKGQYRTIRLGELSTDGRFNRPVSRNAVARMTSEFNPQSFGTLELWEREDGALVILDGQHRAEAARRFGVPLETKCIPAIVHRDLSLEQAAELFVRLNATKLVSGFEKFHALRTSGDPETLAINSIVRATGMAVTGAPSDGAISCIMALRKVYQQGEPHGVILAQVLSTLHEAWGQLSEAYRSAIIRGLARYFHEHRHTPPKALADALVRGPGAPMNLIGWAKTVAGTQRMPLDQAIAEVIEQRIVKKVGRVTKAGSG